MYIMKLGIIIYSIVVIIYLCVHIYKNERARIEAMIRKCHSPIDTIRLTLNTTCLINKHILYIRIFAPDKIILHEIAHSMSTDIGHTPEFVYNFALLNAHSSSIA
jgi:hypothetical protein